MNRIFNSIMRNYSSAVTKPKRFYKIVDVVAVENEPTNEDEKVVPKLSYQIQLDKRILKTQAGKTLQLASEPLALAIAQEWDAQKDVINKSHMLLSGLAITCIDNPFHETKESLTEKILEFFKTDTLLYFAPPDENESRLHHEQQNLWSPIIHWANHHHNLNIRASENLIENPEIPENSMKNVKRWLLSNNFAVLNGIQYASETVKSLLLTMATIAQELDIEKAVELARLEQIFQSKIWGNVEWSHDIDHYQQCSRLSAAILFVHLSSNLHTITTLSKPPEKIASLK